MGQNSTGKNNWGSLTYHYVVRGIGVVKIEQYFGDGNLGYEAILKETDLK
jgi:hypothetical protein